LLRASSEPVKDTLNMWLGFKSR